MTKNEVAYFYHLICDSPPLRLLELPGVNEVLEKFLLIFIEPKRLPPHTSIDHHIVLISRAQPVNINQYRYPHFQKNEIERLTTEMIQQGLV